MDVNLLEIIGLKYKIIKSIETKAQYTICLPNEKRKIFQNIEELESYILKRALPKKNEIYCYRSYDTNGTGYSDLKIKIFAVNNRSVVYQTAGIFKHSTNENSKLFVMDLSEFFKQTKPLE